MALSSDLISQFVEVTKNDKDTKKESTVYGTVTIYNGKQYVKLDGSDLLTPVSSTTVNEDGERVIVTIKNHTATVTGNVSNPSASTGQVQEIGDQISEFEIVVADKVSTKEFDAQVGRIDELVSDNVTIKDRLTASEAEIDDLTADNATINGKLTANEADIENLKATKIDADVANAKYATIENLEATNADIHNLEADYGDFKVLTTEKFTAQEALIKDLDTKKLSAEDAKIMYANIDFANIGKAAIENFFSKSGMIGDLVVGDGTITGTLVGVTIKGDLIEGGTVVADKLVIKGTDGLYYKLNTNGETVESKQTDYNSLSGQIITAHSITAEKISVNDLVAFDATIGGFKITEDSIYSGVKETIDNTTRGVYMDDTGQFAVGDTTNFLKYFKDSDGNWKLEIESEGLTSKVSQKVVEEVSKIEIGARNYIPNSSFNSGIDDYTVYGEKASETVTNTVELDAEKFNGNNVAVIERTGSDGSGRYGIQTTPTITSYSAGESFVLSAWIYVVTALDDESDDNDIFVRGTRGESTQVDEPIITIPSSTETGKWIKMVSDVYTAPEDGIFSDFYVLLGKNGKIKISQIKLEKGTVATDWTPAPEDVQEGINNAQSTADEANSNAIAVDERVTISESEIQQLSDSISMLVTDSEGNSMMTQTSDGWRFDISSITDNINSAAEQLNELSGKVADADHTIQNVKDLADDLAEKTAYIVMTTDDSGDPCIELGKSDNDFKLRITNESIDFMDGSSRIAYVSNQMLYITKAVIKDELQIGEGSGFVWKKRSNGNMGLRWVGG